MCHDPVKELRSDHFSCNERARTVGPLNSFLGKTTVSILTLTVSLVSVYFIHTCVVVFFCIVLLFQRRTDMIATLA